ncbi:TPA: S-layer homology domain-containing protein [Candidatus Gracilibacteria bacterium]|nr:trypsin-like serine protease [Candidatus Peregrinibacteria bacterium]HIQ56544.1 S-layer homology domain-containing protein [Candidatus Gracilibacteria bacterium]HIQ57413.1 S-layer homology domain-containing protein [Candidatus Gracilibacteria bacterium]
MLNFIKLLLVSLFVASGAVFASSENNFSSEKMGTVYLSIGNSRIESVSGTGVIINEKFNIITNHHVVESIISGKDDLIKVCFTYDEEKKPSCIGTASIEKYDEEKDLALLNIYIHEDYLSDKDVKPYYNKFNANFNFVLNESVNIADSIYVFGYPGVGGNTITYTSGKVSGFEDFYIKTDVTVNSGNSGGAAYNQKGEIIGLVTAVSGGQGNIGWIVKSSEIENFLKNTIFDESTNSEICGNHQYKSGRYDACKCEVGFKFDGMKKNCIPDLKYLNCGTLESASFFNPSTTSCICEYNHVWAFPDIESDYSCVEEEKIVQVDGGACSSGSNNYYSLENEECYCSDGFMWEDSRDLDNLTCIEKVEYTCETIYGVHAHKNSEDNLCYCEIGYEWSGLDEKGNNTCVSDGSDLFYDVASADLNFAGIKYVKKNGLVDGYDDGSYKPEKKITRAEFTKIILLAKYSTAEISRTRHFNISDVHADDWHYDYVNFAKQQGVVNGYDDGSFRPNDQISFAEASKILVNTLIGYREIGYGEKWWLPFTQALIDRNVKQFDLSYVLTRGDMATLIYQILR